VDKGGLLKQALEATRPDFVLVVGDDHSDEPAFTALSQWLKQQQAGTVIAFGCVVGKKPSRAPYFVDDQSAAAALLETLKWGSLRNAKSLSSGDVASLDASGGAPSARRPSNAGGGGGGPGGYLARSSESLPSHLAPSYAPPPVYALPPNGILDGVTGMKSNGSHQQVWRPSMPTVQGSPEQLPNAPAAPPAVEPLTPSHMHQQQQKQLGGSRLPAGRRNRNNSNTKLASTHEEGEMMTIGSLPHASSGGCPYRQEETGPSHPKVKGELTDQTPMLTLMGWVVAIALISQQRSRIGFKRRIVLAILAAVLATPKWRRKLLHALPTLNLALNV